MVDALAVVLDVWPSPAVPAGDATGVADAGEVAAPWAAAAALLRVASMFLNIDVVRLSSSRPPAWSSSQHLPVRSAG